MSIYRQSTLGTDNNQITFNLLGQYPYYRMTARALTRRELVEFDIKLPEGMGDADYQTLQGKVYYLLSGTMYPRDESSYDTGRRALRKVANLAIEQADSESDQGYVPYTWQESDLIDKTINLKVMYVDLPESSRNGLKQPFRILCKIKYPVILGPIITTSVGSSTSTISGSSGLPFGLPIGLGSTTYSSTGALTNDGDLPTYPSIVIWGPISNPRLTNSTTGEYIELTTSLASSSDSLIITYDADTLEITQAGATVLDKLTSGSKLFKLISGINQLTLSGATVGAGAHAVVSAPSAWALS